MTRNSATEFGALLPGDMARITRLQRCQKRKLAVLSTRLGPELFSALLFVLDLKRLESINDPVARRRLAQLRAWMGFRHWDALQKIVEQGSMTKRSNGDHDIHAAIRTARDSLVMVVDYSEECLRWGIK